MAKRILPLPGAKRRRHFPSRPSSHLRRLFLRFNRQYFGNSLSTAVFVGWSPHAGWDGEGGCFYIVHEKYGRPAIFVSRDSKGCAREVRHTLIHEMAHFKLAFNTRVHAFHGPAFRREMLRLRRAGAYEPVTYTMTQYSIRPDGTWQRCKGTTKRITIH